jgi:hypothetical protein
MPVPLAQAQTATYEWGTADIRFDTSGLQCAIRLERVYAAGSPSWVHLQLRNTGPRALTVGGAHGIHQCRQQHREHIESQHQRHRAPGRGRHDLAHHQDVLRQQASRIEAEHRRGFLHPELTQIRLEHLLREPRDKPRLTMAHHPMPQENP